MQDSQEQTPSPPPTLSQMNKLDWAEFRRHPATQVLHRFLRDFQAALQREAWAHLLQADRPDNDLLTKMAARANTLLEIADLELEHIKTFYNLETEEDSGINSVTEEERLHKKVAEDKY